MGRGARKLLQALNPAARRRDVPEAPVMPLLPGRRFDGANVAMNARGLVERLCYERFTGCVYLQHADDAGREMQAAVVIEDDRATGALCGDGSSDLLGKAAWERIRSLQALPECLALRVDPELLACYSGLISDCVAEGASANEKRLRQVTETFHATGATGLVRVSGELGQKFEFYKGGASCGLFEMRAGSGELFPASSSTTLQSLVKSESWGRRAPQVLVPPSASTKRPQVLQVLAGVVLPGAVCS